MIQLHEHVYKFYSACEHDKCGMCLDCMELMCEAWATHEIHRILKEKAIL